MTLKKKFEFLGGKGVAHTMIFYLFLAFLFVLVGYAFLSNTIPAFGKFIMDQITGGGQIDSNLDSALRCADLRCRSGCAGVTLGLTFQGECGSGNTEGICDCNKDYCLPFMDSEGKVCGDNSKAHPIKVVMGNTFSIPSSYSSYKYVAIDPNCGWTGGRITRTGTTPDSILVLDSNMITGPESCVTGGVFKLVSDSCSMYGDTYYVWGDVDKTIIDAVADYHSVICGENGGDFDSAHKITVAKGGETQMTVHLANYVGSSELNMVIGTNPGGASQAAIIKIERLPTDGCSSFQYHPIVDITCNSNSIVGTGMCKEDKSLACGGLTFAFVSTTAPTADMQADVVFTIKYP
jgi:hypothetical protein